MGQQVAQLHDRYMMMMMMMMMITGFKTDKILFGLSTKAGDFYLIPKVKTGFVFSYRWFLCPVPWRSIIIHVDIITFITIFTGQ